MDATEAIEPRRSLLRTWSRRSRPPTDEQLAAVNRQTWQLPVLLSGRWSTAMSLGNADAAIRLQAALWELAASKHVPVGPQATVAEVATSLAERGALAPAAASAAAVLADALADDGFDETASRLVGRLIGHLELRARYG
ncbi:MAG TPA: hypothetical protein VM938_14610 [Acidimicrobiales bacterium]|nr:hypothetical protein [Acidimicrobiales bacterium]